MNTLQEAEQEREMDAHDLYLCLDKFISHNKSHRVLERRWLAMMASQLAKIALGLKTDSIKALSEHHQQAILDFRLGEIQLEQNNLDRANKKLADEVETIKKKRLESTEAAA
jgi:predicted negative regulator of RcsB-dependent stress response